jgi:hypothetical protein
MHTYGSAVKVAHTQPYSGIVKKHSSGALKSEDPEQAQEILCPACVFSFDSQAWQIATYK